MITFGEQELIKMAEENYEAVTKGTNHLSFSQLPKEMQRRWVAGAYASFISASALIYSQSAGYVSHNLIKE
ncbi:MAG TPA: hypothetical protein PLP33_29200 [Leptospiraceae bacterium]|nr:hypothetical protein [Leptospiraceae bacterium]